MRIDHDNVINVWLLEAKKLHKYTQSQAVSQVLPVLRRLLSNNVLIEMSLPELKNKVSMIQRKHLLQLLAIEHGYESWAKLKQFVEVANKHDEPFLPYRIALNNAGYPTLWFSTLSEAEEYQYQHAGKVISVGEQAAWLPER